MLNCSKSMMTKFLCQVSFNIVLAAGLAFLGVNLGVDLYLAAIFAFGVRLFQNIAIIRRILLTKLDEKCHKKNKTSIE